MRFNAILKWTHLQRTYGMTNWTTLNRLSFQWRVKRTQILAFVTIGWFISRIVPLKSVWQLNFFQLMFRNNVTLFRSFIHRRGLSWYNQHKPNTQIGEAIPESVRNCLVRRRSHKSHRLTPPNPQQPWNLLEWRICVNDGMIHLGRNSKKR